MKKIIINIFIAIVCLFSMILLCSCSSEDGNYKNNEENGTDSTASGYEFPEESGFVLSADIVQSTVKKGENIVIQCSLKNETGTDCYIRHGFEAISYVYNGSEEIMNSMAVEENFAAGAEITRTVTVPSDESGTIAITADFTVLEDEYSQNGKEYHYQKPLEITVR